MSTMGGERSGTPTSLRKGRIKGRHGMRSKKRFLLLAALPLAAAASFTGGGVSPTVVHAFDPSKAPEIQDRLLDGLASFEFKTGTEINASQPINNYTARSDD